MKNVYLLLFSVFCIISCSDSEENYLGNWDATFIAINDQEPFVCSSSWLDVFKLDDGSMQVELEICDEEFFSITNNYNYNTIEFGFVERPTVDLEIVVEGTLEYMGGGELELRMYRDIYIDGFIASGKDY